MNSSSATIIQPTVGRVVWYYPPTNSAESGFRRSDGGQPLAAIVARVWTDDCVNLTVFDADGAAHSRTSIRLVQDGEAPPEHAGHCEWMPFQKGQAKAQTSPAPGPDAHIRNVLYGAIRNAMEELGALHPGFNDHVNRAWNYLHSAFWSEVPAPASALGLRETVATEQTMVRLPVRDDHREEPVIAGAADAVSAAAGFGPHFDFGDAIRHLKDGRRVAREGWNGKGMFVYLNRGSECGSEMCGSHTGGVPRRLFDAGDFGTVTRMPNFNMRAADGSTVTGWLASQTDMLAEDWMVVA